MLSDTLYNTILMMDHTGCIVATPGQTGSKLLKPHQVAALYSFFKRDDVNDYVIKAMRRHLKKKAKTDENMRFMMDLIDTHMPLEEPITERPMPPAELEPVMQSIIETVGDKGCGTVTNLEQNYDCGVAQPPYIYRHAGQLWICTHAGNDPEGVKIDPPQRVNTVTHIPEVEYVVIVSESEMWTLESWCVEKQLAEGDPAMADQKAVAFLDGYARGRRDMLEAMAEALAIELPKAA